MKKLLSISATVFTLALTGCQTGGGIQVANVPLGSTTAKAVRVPATMNTPGMVAVAVPNGRKGGYNVAAVGGNGVQGDIINAIGTAAGGALGGALGGGGATAIAKVVATATAINN